MGDACMMIGFEYLGPSLGWGVRFSGHRYLRFVPAGKQWEPSFFKVPHWLTSGDIDVLREIVAEVDLAYRKMKGGMQNL